MFAQYTHATFAGASRLNEYAGRRVYRGWRRAMRGPHSIRHWIENFDGEAQEHGANSRWPCARRDCVVVRRVFASALKIVVSSISWCSALYWIRRHYTQRVVFLFMIVLRTMSEWIGARVQSCYRSGAINGLVEVLLDFTGWQDPQWPDWQRGRREPSEWRSILGSSSRRAWPQESSWDKLGSLSWARSLPVGTG